MATTSRVPATKAQIVTTLAAALSGVDVRWGPAPGDPQAEAVYVVGTTGRNEFRVLASGRVPHQEIFAVDLVIDVYLTGAGHTPQAAEERAFVLYNAVEDMVADDPTISSNVDEARVGDYSIESGFTTEGSAARIECEIDCRVRLTRA